jgi:hypothetical protein
MKQLAVVGWQSREARIMVDVRVKPLEWSTDELGRMRASTEVGVYLAERGGEYFEIVLDTWATLPGFSVSEWIGEGGLVAAEERAYKAAQADYERRIRSTLSDAVQPKAERSEPVDDEGVIDQLRLKAFATNSPADRDAYFNACSKWFQDRHYRRLSPHTSKSEPVAWQRRIKYPTQPGAVSPWVTCSADEATGHFERSTLHEYRCLYTSPQTSELEAENARLKRLCAGLHDEVQFMREKAVTNGQQHRAAEARLVEALKALDDILKYVGTSDPWYRLKEAREIIDIAARRVREGGKVE